LFGSNEVVEGVRDSVGPYGDGMVERGLEEGRMEVNIGGLGYGSGSGQWVMSIGVEVFSCLVFVDRVVWCNAGSFTYL
jgi:hypothetical protein